MPIRLFFKELFGERVEGELFSSAFYSFIISITVFAVFYFTNILGSSSLNLLNFSMFFLAILSYSVLIPTFRQIRAYGKHEHTEGMMIGMTIGMLSGFLSGFFIGATNGMFVGGVFGMFVGLALGIWMGYCCGIMGILEGAMAGFMGGLMGAMTAVMTLNDHVIIMGIIVFLISSFIIGSLWYMIYTSTNKRKRELKENYSKEIIISLILTLLTIIIMFFGPRSFLFQ